MNIVHETLPNGNRRTIESYSDPGRSVTAVYIDSKTPPRTALVEFTGIIPVDGLVAVEFTDGKFNWCFRCKASGLQSFKRFQLMALHAKGVWIDHESQHESRAGRRADEWDEAVRVAFQRGEAVR